MKEKEISKEKLLVLIEKLAREGNPPSKIGLILRDQYGIGNVKEITGESLTQLLEKTGVKRGLPEDLANLIRKAVTIINHLSTHRKDFRSKRALEIVEGKINALARYYIRKGKLPKDWKYERERAALLLK